MGPALSVLLTIGIDVTPLQIRRGRHGIGSYLHGLLPALARRDGGHHYRLFAWARYPLALPSLPSSFTVVELPAPAAGRGTAALTHQVALPFLARRHGLSALHIPHVSVTASIPGIPLWSSVPLVVTVHDLIPLHFPDTVLPRWRHRAFYRLMLRAAGRAAHVLCDSEATRRDLLAVFPRIAARTTVVPLAPDPFFGEEPAGDDGPQAAILPRPGYVLHVGGPAPAKNLDRLVRAMEDLWATRDVDSELVCVSAIALEAARLGTGGGGARRRIRVLSDVTMADLRWLYRHAACLAFPSLYEGFGLPVLEAMAAGCPVVASRAASLPEVGGEAAVYVDPLDVAGIRQALGEVLGDPERRARMRAAGRAQAGRFSYDSTAAATLAVYQRVGRAR